jgi:hypothetical protein
MPCVDCFSKKQGRDITNRPKAYQVLKTRNLHFFAFAPRLNDAVL